MVEGIGKLGVDFDLDNSTNDQTGRIALERTASSAFIGMALASDSRDGIEFLTGDGSETERVRINEDVGIGTDDPQKPLHIKSNTAAIMRLQVLVATVLVEAPLNFMMKIQEWDIWDMEVVLTLP